MAEERTPKENTMPGPRGARGMRGPRPKIENPGKLFRRLMGYVLKNYAPHYAIVVICIVANVFASTQGTMFMKTLIDSYIIPLLGNASPDFTPLAHAIAKVACFYACGVVASFIQARIMVLITQVSHHSLRD